MRKALWIAAIVVLALAAVLLVPFALPKPQRAPLAGPELSDFRYEEIRFSNGDLALAGLLFLPERAGPHPAAVFIHGSGTSRRAKELERSAGLTATLITGSGTNMFSSVHILGVAA